MIKREYQVTLGYMTNGEIVFDPITGEAAEAVINQARRGQDIRYSFSNDTGDYTELVPWSAVVSVLAHSTVTNTVAPEDDVCKEYHVDGITLGSTITDAVGARYEGTGEYRTVLYYEDNTSQTIRPYDSDSVKALVDSVIIDGEDVTDTAEYSYEGENIEEATKVSMTFTATAGDKSVSKTVTLPYRSE